MRVITGCIASMLQVRIHDLNEPLQAIIRWKRSRLSARACAKVQLTQLYSIWQIPRYHSVHEQEYASGLHDSCNFIFVSRQ